MKSTVLEASNPPRDRLPRRWRIAGVVAGLGTLAASLVGCDFMTYRNPTAGHLNKIDCNNLGSDIHGHSKEARHYPRDTKETRRQDRHLQRYFCHSYNAYRSWIVKEYKTPPPGIHANDSLLQPGKLAVTVLVDSQQPVLAKLKFTSADGVPNLDSISNLQVYDYEHSNLLGKVNSLSIAYRPAQHRFIVNSAAQFANKGWPTVVNNRFPHMSHDKALGGLPTAEELATVGRAVSTVLGTASANSTPTPSN